MMASRWSGRVALITGASAGIGLAVTKQLARLGMTAIGCARNIDNIKALAEELPRCQTPNITGSIHAIRCDVSDESDVFSMFSEIKKNFGGVDVCVNNAGMCRPGNLLDGDAEGWAEMIKVNVLGLSMCTREAIKSMRERNVDDGHVIHINSTSGHRVRQNDYTHFYAATKFAVTALTEGLRLELRAIKSHIRVTGISPGRVNTEFLYRALGQETGDAEYNRFKTLEADDIADAVVYALQTPPHVQVHDILLRGTEQPL